MVVLTIFITSYSIEFVTLYIVLRFYGQIGQRPVVFIIVMD